MFHYPLSWITMALPCDFLSSMFKIVGHFSLVWWLHLWDNHLCPLTNEHHDWWGTLKVICTHWICDMWWEEMSFQFLQGWLCFVAFQTLRWPQRLSYAFRQRCCMFWFRFQNLTLISCNILRERERERLILSSYYSAWYIPIYTYIHIYRHTILKNK